MAQIDVARQRIATVIGGVPTGGSVLSITDLSRLAHVGRGTAQLALDSLRSAGVIHVEARGARGRVLTSCDRLALSRISDPAGLTAMFPLPYSREFYLVLTAMTQYFAQLDLQLRIAFAQGSVDRATAIHSGKADFMVASQFAVEKLCGPDSCEVLTGIPYYHPDSVAIIQRSNPGHHVQKKELRVAVDFHSADHVALSQAEYPDAQYVDVRYADIPASVLNEAVDAGVWHDTSYASIRTLKDLTITPLQHALQGMERVNTCAVAWSPVEPRLRFLFEDLLRRADLMTTYHNLNT